MGCDSLTGSAGCSVTIVRRLTVGLATVMLVGACSSTTVRTVGDNPTTSPPVTTTLSTIAATDTTAAVNATPGPVVAPAAVPPAGANCPMVRTVPPSQFLTEDQAAVQNDELERLQPDILAVDAYGREHPTEWMGVQPTDDHPRRIKASFSGHRDEHEAALKALVARPDILDVTLNRHTPNEVEAAQTFLLTEIAKNQRLFSTYQESYQLGQSVVLVELVPGQEKLALDLIKRFGDILMVSVGALPFVPDGCGPQPTPRKCPDLAGTDPATVGLELSIVVDTPTISQGAVGQAKLVERNIGTAPFSLGSGRPVVGMLVYPGTLRVAGEFTGGIAGVGGGPQLAPGESGAIDMYFGTGRCDGGPGSAVPPGVYGLRIALTSEGPNPGTYPKYLSPEVQVTVTE
jgi:hypothetical protein